MPGLTKADIALLWEHAHKIAARLRETDPAARASDIFTNLLTYAETQGMPAVQRQIDLQHQMAAAYRARQSRHRHAW